MHAGMHVCAQWCARASTHTCSCTPPQVPVPNSSLRRPCLQADAQPCITSCVPCTHQAHIRHAHIMHALHTPRHHTGREAHGRGLTWTLHAQAPVQMLLQLGVTQRTHSTHTHTTCTHSHTDAHTHTNTHAHTRACTHVRTHKHATACADAHAHAHRSVHAMATSCPHLRSKSSRCGRAYESPSAPSPPAFARAQVLLQLEVLQHSTAADSLRQRLQRQTARITEMEVRAVWRQGAVLQQCCGSFAAVLWQCCGSSCGSSCVPDCVDHRDTEVRAVW